MTLDIDAMEERDARGMSAVAARDDDAVQCHVDRAALLAEVRRLWQQIAGARRCGLCGGSGRWYSMTCADCSGRGIVFPEVT